MMKKNIGKFGYDSTQQRTKKMESPSLRTLKIEFKLVTCVYFTKNTPFRLRSLCLRYDVNNTVNI